MSLPARIPRTVPQGKREPREGDSAKHLKWLRTLECAVCGNCFVEVHHLKKSIDNQPKGMGRKREDRWGLPLCREHHSHVEAGDDEARLLTLCIDGRALANALWRVSGDTDAAHRLLYRARTTR
jgi:hypothetical protein